MNGGTPLLAAEGVCVRLGGALVVDHADIALRGGEFVGMVGPNGAGKTTLMRALAGLLPAEGRIALSGQPLASLAPRERARRLAYLPQGHVFHWPIAVRDVVMLGRHPHFDSFTGASAADRAAVERALAATAAVDFAERPVTTLSGGERARVAIARTLATEAPILLADEPTSALDPRHQLTVMDLLRRIARAGGAVLAILHDLALAARFCDRVVVMDRGRIAADAPPAVALRADLIASVFGVEIVSVESGDGLVPLARRPL